MFKFILVLIIFCFFSPAYAKDQAQPLAADRAFVLSAKIDGKNQLISTWEIAPGYYLYKDELTFNPAPNSEVKIGAVLNPPGHLKQDTVRGKYQAYFDKVTINTPLIVEPNKTQFHLLINYQGCSSAGFCYPPIKKILNVNLSKIKTNEDVTPCINELSKLMSTSAGLTDQGYAASVLAGHNLGLIILSFLALGLLLAFTPCVLPMIPILSSIIVGQGKKISKQRAFLLSLAYVMGMALTYALAGILIALMGSGVQVALQKPWIIILFSLLFVVLAMSLFGLFELRLPNKLQQWMSSFSNRHTNGTYIGVFLMGVLSTLIVSPCVSAPLVGVLAYIANSGDITLGGVALLALGIGMGIPLLLLGASIDSLLPKAGPWMNKVKQVFGFMMLGLSIWMIARILLGPIVLFLWAILVIAAAIFFWRLEHSKKLRHKLHQGLGLIILSYGFILMGGAFVGQSDPLFLLNSNQYLHAERTSFHVMKDMTELNAQLELAKKNNQEVLLDFYADWCASCVVMDRHVFNQPEIKNTLSKYVLLRLDVTKNNMFDKQMLKRFGVIAPPTMIFFNEKGDVQQDRIVGEVNARELFANINRSKEEKAGTCKTGLFSC